MKSNTTERKKRDKYDNSEISTLSLTTQQAKLLDNFSKLITTSGGPQSENAQPLAAHAATELKLHFDEDQRALTQQYVNGEKSALIIEGLANFDTTPPPIQIAPIHELEQHPLVLYLGARNQILLKILDHRAFAYDIDNHGKLIRLVGNFKGGGKERLVDEPRKIEISSHSGLSLGPHTEAPYWCAAQAQDGHSPSPSALILTAMWNPKHEPTNLIPLPQILERIGATNTLCLASRNFNFTRSDSFNCGQGEDGTGVSIVEFDPHFGFTARFNSYRFSVSEDAPALVKRAYGEFCRAVSAAAPFQYSLSQDSAIVINNTRALHCRDIVRDNRRLLVRVFGYSKFARAIAINENPLIVQG